MGFVVKVTVHKHSVLLHCKMCTYETSDSQFCSKLYDAGCLKSCCFADAEYLVEKAIGTMLMTESTKNYILKYLALLI